MRRRRVVRVAPIALLLATLPLSALTDVQPAPAGEEDMVDILEKVYGIGNFVRVDDEDDQFWGTEGVTSTVTASFVSTFSAAREQLGICVFCDGTDDIFFDQTFQQDGINMSLMTVSGMDEIDVFGRFRWLDDPTESPLVGRVYSDQALNPGGDDHMVTFALLGIPNTYVIAFEDWRRDTFGVSDRDFNDFLVQVTINPLPPAVPEPSTLALLASALGLWTWRRRRKNSAH